MGCIARVEGAGRGRVPAVGGGLLLVVAWAIASGGLSASDSEWYVDPITVKVMHDQRAPFPFSAKRVDLAGQRGEAITNYK